MTFQTSNKRIKIAVVGDLLLTAKLGNNEPQRGLEAISDEIRDIFSDADIVLANLECTLPSDDNVTTEPRVFSSIEQIRSIKDSGINLITLGNNHCFDGGNEGFLKLTSLLTDLNISYFGAGLNIKKASEPAIVQVNGISFAFLAPVDTSSGMHRFATNNSSGALNLSPVDMCQQISALTQRVDHVIVTPHWGEERFRFPSPEQIEQAQKFTQAGASLVVGHHPHVMQGLEYHNDAGVVYSLGNFLANNVFWDNGDFLTWNRFERTGCIILAEADKHRIRNIRQLPVYDDGVTIQIERNGWGQKYISRANKMLKKGISSKLYNREIFRVRAILPIIGQLRWKKLKRIRPAHLGKIAKLLFRK